MPIKQLAIFLLLTGCCVGQVCPSSQGSGVQVGLCGSGPASIQILPSTPSIQVGTTLQLSANYLLTDNSLGGSVGSGCDGAWSSDAPTVATVSSRGLVTGIANGTANISCTNVGTVCNGGSACTGTIPVSVLNPPVFTYPNQQQCVQPCALKQGFGPPSAQAYSDQVTASGSTHTPYTFSISAGSLPAWASLNSSTGVISGTPNAVAVTIFTVQVCDTVPSCNTVQVSLTVVANLASYYPLSTTSAQTQNKVAGQNSNVPTTLWGSAAATTVSVTSNIVTISVANGFTAGSGAGACSFGNTCGDLIALSGFTTVTWLNGLILGANSSTNGTTIVGPVFNTKGTQVTHADVGSTSETGIYGQGTGWQSWVTAPFPAAGSTNCTNGNPCAGQSGVLTASDINSFALDYSVPGATGVNKNVWAMWTNPATNAGKVYAASKTSETYDELIGWPDSLGGYFVPMVSSTIFIAHVHYNATGCAGQPCVLLDTPVPSGWYGSNAFGLGCSQLPINPPTNQSAPCYYADISNQFDPKVVKQVYQYNATGCAGQPCVTLLSNTVLADIPTICPAWKFTIAGSLLGYAKAVTVGSTDNLHDTDLNFALGTGPQNGLAKSMEFHIMNLNTTPTCENWDTAGRSGTAMYNDGTTFGLQVTTQGTNYKVGDVISFNSGSNCVGTTTIASITGTGQVKVSGGLSAPTMTTNSGCNLGTVLILSGGSGTGLAITVSGVGTNATTCCGTIWPSGSTTPTTTTIDVYGIHGGTMSKGAPIYIANSGWGQTPQPPCGACDNMFWQGGTTTLKPQTSNKLGGHPAVGLKKRGISNAPAYTVTDWSDPTCAIIACIQIGTLPTNPGNAISHSAWPSLAAFSDAGPILITSAVNTPGNPTQTNPEQATSGMAMSIWAADQNGVPRWFFHHYENTNNHATENAACEYVEIIPSPDGKFTMVNTDMKNGFSGNVGLGKDTNNATYCGMFGVAIN